MRSRNTPELVQSVPVIRTHTLVHLKSLPLRRLLSREQRETLKVDLHRDELWLHGLMLTE